MACFSSATQLVGTIVALDSGDTAKAKGATTVEIKALNQKIAAVLGTTADQIMINDMVVNPTSKRVYISVSRGKGADAIPVILPDRRQGRADRVVAGQH